MIAGIWRTGMGGFLARNFEGRLWVSPIPWSKLFSTLVAMRMPPARCADGDPPAVPAVHYGIAHLMFNFLYALKRNPSHDM